MTAVGLGPTVAPAGAAAAPEKTDIMFVFDTSGSMGGVLTEAKEGIKKVIEETSASLPNVAYGVANVEDVPDNGEGSLTEEEYEKDNEKPWRLDQPVTTETSKAIAAIEALTECSSGDGGTTGGCGGDGPEAYGRALWETDTNPQVGWREGARHEIVLIADNVPHTPNVNQGIPEEFWLENPFDTGEEASGRLGIPDTQWTSGDSLEFHKTLEMLDLDGKPLAMVNYFHTGESETSDYIHYWEYWADQTGGEALEAKEGGEGEFANKLVTIIKETTGRALPACPTGYEPRVSEGACVPVPPPTPPSTPPSSGIHYGTTPPKSITVIIDEEDGEIEEEDEFDESGSGDLSGEVDNGAEDARFRALQVNPLAAQFGQAVAVSAKKGKSKKCKKGYVKKGKKCVNNAPIPYGSVSFTIPAPGKYKFKLKPSSKALAALKQGKSLNVKVTLEFTPTGSTSPIISTKFVRVHLKPKKHHHKHKHKK